MQDCGRGCCSGRRTWRTLPPHSLRPQYVSSQLLRDTQLTLSAEKSKKKYASGLTFHSAEAESTYRSKKDKERSKSKKDKKKKKADSEDEEDDDGQERIDWENRASGGAKPAAGARKAFEYASRIVSRPPCGAFPRSDDTYNHR